MFSHSPRYYPPAFGKHFVQNALSLTGEREFLAGPREPQVWTLSEMQSTDLELWAGVFEACMSLTHTTDHNACFAAGAYIAGVPLSDRVT